MITQNIKYVSLILPHPAVSFCQFRQVQNNAAEAAVARFQLIQLALISLVSWLAPQDAFCAICGDVVGVASALEVVGWHDLVA